MSSRLHGLTTRRLLGASLTAALFAGCFAPATHLDAEAESRSAATSQASAEADMGRTASPLSLIVDSGAFGGVHFELTNSIEDPSRPPMLRGQTNGAGKAELTVDFEPIAGATLELWVRVREPGLQQHVAAIQWSKEYERWIAQPRIETGGTVRGRAFDAEGRPVTGQVRMTPSTGIAERIVGFGPRSLAGGWFEFHFRGFARGHLTVSSYELGTGVVSDLTLNSLEPSQDLEVELNGPGALHGRIVNPDGEAVRGLQVIARLADAPTRALGGGHLETRTTTDKRGFFQLGGLKSARYSLAAGPRHSGGPETQLTTVAVVADAPQLELGYPDPRLVVDLIDATGAPWKGATELSTWGWGVFERESWPKIPTVLVQRCSRTGREGSYAVSGDDLLWGDASRERFVFEVTPGETYAVTVIGGPFAGPPQVVSFDAQTRTRRVEVRAHEEMKEAKLEVCVEIAGVERSGRETEGPFFQVAIEDPLTGLRFVTRERASTFKLPPGMYSVVLEGRSQLSPCYASIREARTMGRTERIVELAPHGKHKLTVPLEVGGTVSILVEGEPSDEDIYRAQRMCSSIHSPGAQIWFERAGAAPESVYSIDRDSLYGDLLSPKWALGHRQTAEVLPAGPGILVARLPGGREVRQPLEILSGETHEVELTFPPAQ